MSFVNVRIRNVKELADFMESLPAGVRNNALRAGLKKGGDVVRDEAKRLAPKRPAEQRRGIPKNKSLSRRIKTKRRRGTRDTVLVQVVSEAPHSHLVEFGTKPRRQIKTGRYTGVMPSHPFMRPAAANKRKEVLNVVTLETGRFLERKSNRKAIRVLSR